MADELDSLEEIRLEQKARAILLRAAPAIAGVAVELALDGNPEMVRYTLNQVLGMPVARSENRNLNLHGRISVSPRHSPALGAAERAYLEAIRNPTLEIPADVEDFAYADEDETEYAEDEL